MNNTFEGLMEAERLSTLHSGGELILSGQFHARFQFDLGASVVKDVFGLRTTNQFAATYWFGLLEACLVMSRDPILQKNDLLAPRRQGGIFGIIDFQRGHLMRGSISSSPVSPLHTITLTW